jgi:hypothetical protein
MYDRQTNALPIEQIHEFWAEVIVYRVARIF